MSGPVRRSSLGCLGVFSIFCLTLFSAAELGLAWWLNASWFDRVAFWRAPRVEPEDVALDGPEADAARKRWAAEEVEPPRGPRPDPAKPVLIAASTVTADYAPGSGGSVSDPGNGATVRLPAGALAGAAKVSLTQAVRVPAAMRGPFAGPVYDVKIDGREHTAFQRPIELTLPYAKGLVPDDQAVVTVWENGRWTPLPSRVDPLKGMVTATSPHASVFSVSNAAKLFRFTPGAGWGLTILSGILAGAENSTARAAGFAVLYGRSHEYETPEGNFKLHYYTHGSGKIPRDWEVLNDPFTPKDDDPDRAPLYVRRLGHWLEYCRKEMHAEGYDLPPAKLIRYDCFVVPDGETGGNLGASSLGGPLFISPRIHEIAAAADGGPFDPETVMKATCAHELAHVAQGKYYSTLKAELLPWSKIERLCEADAEYTSVRFWLKRDMRDPFHERLVASVLALPSFRFDQTGETERYAYSLWFEWMQARFDEQTARDFLAAAHQGADGSIASMDAAARKVLAPKGLATLGDAMAAFAADYYHRDWWTAKLNPRIVRCPLVSAGLTRYFDEFGGVKKSDFMTIARKTQNGSVVRVRYQQASRASVPPLTSRAAYVLSHTLVSDPDQPRPKLVIEAEGAAATSDALHLVVAKGRMTNPFGPGPGDGDPGDVEALAANGSRRQVVVKDFAYRDGPNVATLLVTNRSLDADLGGLTIRRWLLEPPPFVQLERQTQDEPKWLLKWKVAPLEKHPDAFGHYRVYRRPLRSPRDVKELVKDVAALSGAAELVKTELEGKDVGDFTYAVAVVDVRGNESDPRDADLNDPFVGTWEGSFKLVDGSFVKPIMALIEKKSVEYDAKKAAEIQRIEDPARRESARRSWEDTKKSREELAKLLNDFLGGAEEATRLGVPIRFQIRLDGGKYLFSVTEILWGMLPLDKEARTETELKRVGKLTLRVPDLPEELPPMNFTLTRLDPEGKKPNVIREDDYVLQTSGDAAKELPIRCVFRWDFERTSAEPPPKP